MSARRSWCWCLQPGAPPRNPTVSVKKSVTDIVFRGTAPLVRLWGTGGLLTTPIALSGSGDVAAVRGHGAVAVERGEPQIRESATATLQKLWRL